MRADVPIEMCAGMCADLCIDIHMDMCADVCIGMHIDIHVDMRMGMRIATHIRMLLCDLTCLCHTEEGLIITREQVTSLSLRHLTSWFCPPACSEV